MVDLFVAVDVGITADRTWASIRYNFWLCLFWTFVHRRPMLPFNNIHLTYSSYKYPYSPKAAAELAKSISIYSLESHRPVRHSQHPMIWMIKEGLVNSNDLPHCAHQLQPPICQSSRRKPCTLCPPSQYCLVVLPVRRQQDLSNMVNQPNLTDTCGTPLNNSRTDILFKCT